MAVRAIGELAIFYGDKPNTGEYDNGVWMHLLDIPYIQKVEEAGLYKTIIHTMWLDAIGWHKEIRNRWPHIALIGLSDHPLSAHISKISADKQVAYIKDLQYLDGIMALSEEERSWYSVACPSRPVVNVGLPFPVQTYEERFGKLRASEKKYVGLGVGASDNDRNFVSNVLAFQRLKLEFPDIQGVFLSIPSQLIPYCAYWADNVEGVFIHERKDTEEYMDILSQCKFVFNLADRNTPGRLQAESAFLEIPCIGSERLALQSELYPDLSVNPFDLEKAVNLGREILTNGINHEMVTNARTVLETNYNYETSKQKFDSLLALIRGD